jgi:hypothetical protein
MIRGRIVGKNRGLVFGLMVGRRLMFDDDCMRLNWGSELMMIRVIIARKSRGLVLGLLFGRTLGFDCDGMPLNSSV